MSYVTHRLGNNLPGVSPSDVFAEIDLLACKPIKGEIAIINNIVGNEKNTIGHVFKSTWVTELFSEKVSQFD